MSDASHAAPSPVVDLIDDGMTDDEIAAHTQTWLEDLRKSPVADLGVSAAEVLDQLYADGDL